MFMESSCWRSSTRLDGPTRVLEIAIPNDSSPIGKDSKLSAAVPASNQHARLEERLGQMCLIRSARSNAEQQFR